MLLLHLFVRGQNLRYRCNLDFMLIQWLTVCSRNYNWLLFRSCGYVIYIMKGELLRALGGVRASATLLGVPLGHNSSFLQGPAFAPPRIREAIWCDSTNSTTEEGKNYNEMIYLYVWKAFIYLFSFDSPGLRCAGKQLSDPRVLTDVGDVPVQEIRDCGVDDDRLMNVISESVKLVMEEVN